MRLWVHELLGAMLRVGNREKADMAINKIQQGRPHLSLFSLWLVLLLFWLSLLNMVGDTFDSASTQVHTQHVTDHECMLEHVGSDDLMAVTNLHGLTTSTLSPQ